MPTKPPEDWPLSPALARSLLREQHPDLADLPMRPVPSGWDNHVFRLGGALAFRAPRRALAVALAEREQRWLPVVAASLPVPVPAPLRVGRPTTAFPRPWSVVPWFDGVSAATDSGGPVVEALAAALRALHRPAPPDAPANPHRGVPFIERAGDARRLGSGLGCLDAPLESVLRTAEEAPPWPGPPSWLHGDLHAANLVVRDGRLVALIDFGDLCAGDPATDLAVGWSIADVGTREALLAGHDAATRARARGWAALFALLVLSHSDDDPEAHRRGVLALARVCAEP